MTLERIEAIVEAADANPKRFGHLKDRMDASGKVNKFWQQLRVTRLMDESAPPVQRTDQTPNQIICGDCREILPQFRRNSFDAVIFDPPWGVNYDFDEDRKLNHDPNSYWAWLKPIYQKTLRVLKPGDLWACWQSHNYLPSCWEWFGSDIRIFAACKDEVRLRTGSAYSWEPIILKWKPGPRPLYPYGRRKPLDHFVSDWRAHLRDKLASQHPCPRPLDVLEAIIDNYTLRTALILDPLCGSGSTCIAAARLAAPTSALRSIRVTQPWPRNGSGSRSGSDQGL